MAHNEERNIGNLLKRIQHQKPDKVILGDIFVVSSGSTDKTNEIVSDYAKNDPRIKLLLEEKRQGKASAVNLWLKNTHSDILVLESADTLPNHNSIENLVLPFENSKVGMTGARPVPVDNPQSFMGFVNHLMWNLHHLISLQTPKMGEMVAFRRVFEEIPLNSAVDEASIENIIKSKGYQIKYVPEAVVNNKGPETVKDFLKQRRRIYAGHLALQKDGHQVATISGLKIFTVLLKNISPSLRSIIYTPSAIMLEVAGRFLGWWDFKIKKKDHSIWEIAESTKKLSE